MTKNQPVGIPPSPPRYKILTYNDKSACPTGRVMASFPRLAAPRASPCGPVRRVWSGEDGVAVAKVSYAPVGGTTQARTVARRPGGQAQQGRQRRPEGRAAQHPIGPQEPVRCAAVYGGRGRVAVWWLTRTPMGSWPWFGDRTSTGLDLPTRSHGSGTGPNSGSCRSHGYADEASKSSQDV